MRLATLATAAGPRPAAHVGDDYIDLLAADSTLPKSVRAILAAGPEGLAAAKCAAGKAGGTRTKAAEAKFHAPVPDPAKIICLGLNYRDHAIESGKAIPTEPVLFSKYATSPDRARRIDRHSRGQSQGRLRGRAGGRHRARRAGTSRSSRQCEYVAGYMRRPRRLGPRLAVQGRGKQWMAGKTFDTFAPVGPDLVTADEVPDPHALPIRLRLNGQTMQDSNTEPADLRRAGDPRLPVADHDPGAGRPDLHRHPAGRGHGPQAAGVTEAGRRRRGRDRRPGRARKCVRGRRLATLRRSVLRRTLLRSVANRGSSRGGEPFPLS